MHRNWHLAIAFAALLLAAQGVYLLVWESPPEHFGKAMGKYLALFVLVAAHQVRAWWRYPGGTSAPGGAGSGPQPSRRRQSGRRRRRNRKSK